MIETGPSLFHTGRLDMRIARLVALFTTLTASSTAFAATVTMTPEFRARAQEVCSGDVMQFCPENMMDEQATAACMKARHAELSPDCRAIVEKGVAARK